jgi:hypothetical protein
MKLSEDTTDGIRIVKEPDALSAALVVLNSAVVMGQREITTSFDKVQKVSDRLADTVAVAGQVAAGNAADTKSILENTMRIASGMVDLVSELKQSNSTLMSSVAGVSDKTAGAIAAVVSALKEKKSFRMNVKRGLDLEIESAEFEQI